jgi:hypothetical protein
MVAHLLRFSGSVAKLKRSPLVSSTPATTAASPLKRMRLDDDTAFPPCSKYLYQDKHTLRRELRRE